MKELKKEQYTIGIAGELLIVLYPRKKSVYTFLFIISKELL